MKYNSDGLKQMRLCMILLFPDVGHISDNAEINDNDECGIEESDDDEAEESKVLIVEIVVFSTIS